MTTYLIVIRTRVHCKKCQVSKLNWCYFNIIFEEDDVLDLMLSILKGFIEFRVTIKVSKLLLWISISLALIQIGVLTKKFSFIFFIYHGWELAINLMVSGHSILVKAPKSKYKKYINIRFSFIYMTELNFLILNKRFWVWFNHTAKKGFPYIRPSSLISCLENIAKQSALNFCIKFI